MKAVVLALALGLFFAAVNAAVNTMCIGCAFQAQSKYSPAVTILNPSPSNTVIMMNNGRIYRSVDSGKTWTNVFNDAIRMIPAPNNHNLIYLTGFRSLLNYTTDGGQTFQSSQAPIANNHYRAFDGFLPHPYQDGWVMLNGWQGDSSLDQYKCTIYITKDYGQTWTPYFENITYDCTGSWGNSTEQPDLIWLQAMDKSYGYSTDYKTYHKLFDNVFMDDTRMTRHYQFISVNSKTGSASADLYVSSNRVDPTHTNLGDYRVADFPFGEDIGVNKFYYLDDITDSEFLAVHQERLQGWVTIYSSGPYGASYRLSIDEVYSSSAGINVDFDRLRGMPGVYFVNTIRDRTSYYSAGPTKFTWDNGGSWNYLQVPATDMNGQPWSCTMDCHLNLVGPISMSNVQPVYSTSEAIGMVLANGNVARYLQDQNTPLSTFYSRDSGVTWTQVLPMASYFAIGNRGSVIVAAPRQTQGNFVYYSLDEASTWTPVQVAGDNQVVNFAAVTAHPNGTGYIFLVSGYISGTGYIWVLDLTSVQPRLCDQGDYETYVPHDPYDSSSCFMGALTIYNRKKKSSVCYIPPGVEVITSSVPCPCTFEDYECAFNFDASSRNSSGGFTCTRNGPDRTDCEPGVTYNKPTPQGYVLVPDTQCQGGLNLLGPVAVCPKAGGSVGGGGGGSTAAVVIIPLLLVGIIVAAVVAYKKNEAFYNWVQSFRGGQSTAQYGRVNNDDVEGLLN